DQPIERYVPQRVRADGRPDRIDVQSVRDQLGARGEVDAVEAGPFHRGRRDADVYLDSARLAQHADQGTLGVPPNDRVVDNDQPLAPDDVAERVELHPAAEMTERLGRVDKSPPDIGVLDQARPVRDARRLRVANRSGRARFGYR